MPVIERAIETAALMLGSDRSRGYCLEMICADFLAGANLGQRRSRDAAVLDDEVLQVSTRGAAAAIPVLPRSESFVTGILLKRPRLRLDPHSYKALCRRVLERDSWRCQVCGSSQNLQVHHKQLRSQQGSDEDSNLITLCARCHAQLHGSLTQ